MVPDPLRGRVMSVYAMMVLGMTPFGALLAGWLAERMGAPVTVAASGVFAAAGAAVFAWRLPALRIEMRRLIAVQDLVGAAGGPDTAAAGGAPGAGADGPGPAGVAAVNAGETT